MRRNILQAKMILVEQISVAAVASIPAAAFWFTSPFAFSKIWAASYGVLVSTALLGKAWRND